MSMTKSRGYKTFFKLSSAETKIYPATIVGILTFISRRNYKLWHCKPSILKYWSVFYIYEQLKFYAQLS